MTAVPSRRSRVAALLAGVVLALAVPLAGAASARSEVGAEAAGVGLDVTEVDVSAPPAVRLTLGAPATLVDAALPPEAFAVSEDGEDRAVRVSKLADAELQVVLLTDTSGSMTGAPLEAVQEAALSFVERMPSGVAVSVMGFATEPHEASRFTTDREVSRTAIRALEAGGRTATYDAVMRSLERFEPLDAGRRVVVLLSDGEDNQSTASLEDAAGALRSEGVNLQVVELETRFSNAEALRALAEAGRGEVASIDDVAALTGVYDTIASKLLSQYRVEYRSQAAGEALVRVAVEHDGVRAGTSVVVDVPAHPPVASATPDPAPAPTPAPAPAAAAPPGPRPTTVQPPVGMAALLTGPAAVGAGALLVFLGVAVTILLLLAPRPARSTLGSGVWDRRATGGRHGGLTSVGDWAEERIDRSLRRRGLATRVNQRLEQAGILLKPAEAVVVAGAASLLALAIGSVTGGPLLGLALAAVTGLGLRVYLKARIARRRAAFVAQLADTLQLLSGSLRAGYGLLQAVDSVAREAETPTAEEFRRLVVESRLGRDLADALRAMAERMDSDDFSWVVQAIEIHRDVGGDLAEVLDRVADTIRAREQIARQVKSLSAEGRLSAKVLVGLPILVMGGMAVVNPGYLDELTGSVPGRLMLGFAGLLMTVGSTWIHRLVRIRF